MVQRRCACGGTPGPDGECAACRARRLGLQRHGLQRNAGIEAPVAAVPPVVHEVLRSPGQPLDSATRAFFEPRFGHDFGQIRVHADERAAAAANAVRALAFTVGTQVVFGERQYAPRTVEGTHLLAHELSHVVQQVNTSSSGVVDQISAPGDAAERAADAAAERIVQGSPPGGVGPTPSATTLFRRVGSVNCPPNVFGAPADPRAALEAVDPVAVDLATQAADGLAADARVGIPDPPSVTFISYVEHFGLPNAVGRGFLNRLTGAVRPSIELAASEELHILSRRFRLVARLISGPVSYRCPGNVSFTLPGCAAASCGGAFAISCTPDTTIALCEQFWSGLTSDKARAAVVIHEGMHIMFPIIGDDATKRGPGRNLNIAACYQSIIDDIAGANSRPACPPTP